MCVTPAALDAPVAALVRRCGAPARVASRDAGGSARTVAASVFRELRH